MLQLLTSPADARFLCLLYQRRQTTRVVARANAYSNVGGAAAPRVHSALAGWPTATNQWRRTASHVTTTAPWRMFAEIENDRCLSFVLLGTTDTDY